MIAEGAGGPGSSVIFADLNGDGRAEYIWIDSDGGLNVWLNLGSTFGAKVGWLAQTVTATGVGGGRNNTFLADINGDGRADYLQLGDDGSLSVWRNDGGPDNGPHAGEPVWYPQGILTPGDGTPGARVMFADLNGDGRNEYLEVDPNSSAVKAYLNACPEGQSN